MIRLFNKNPYRALERELGYRFRSKAQLEAAFLHRSYRFENGTDTGADNQRLEFLGDAVLGLVAAAYLFGRFPGQDEGDLTAARSRLTSGAALAKLAKRIDLGVWLKLGKGEERTGGRSRASNLADALEAVLGAAFEDGGIQAVETIFQRLFVPPLAPDVAGEAEEENPKGRLQQICQQRWKTPPVYSVQSEAGPLHAREFRVDVMAGKRLLGRGQGGSKRAAETAAAREALALLSSGNAGEPA